jgi:hypothetical protein
MVLVAFEVIIKNATSLIFYALSLLQLKSCCFFTFSFKFLITEKDMKLQSYFGVVCFLNVNGIVSLS